MKRLRFPPTLLLLCLTLILPGCSTCTADVAPVVVPDTGADAADTGQDIARDTPDEADGGDTPDDAAEDVAEDAPDADPDAEAAIIPSGQGVLAGGGVRRSGRFQVKMSVGGPVAGQPAATDEHRVRVGVGAPQAAEVPPENP